MRISNDDLVRMKKIQIPTLGGRSVVDFIFSKEKITITNSNGREKSYSWSDLDAVHSFCHKRGYGKVGSTYNPMNGGSYPSDYPRSIDTLSLVALAHYMVGSHPYA